MQNQNTWGAMSFGYFLLAATGAGLFGTAVGLDFSGRESLVFAPALAALVLAGVGALLLLLELGNFWRFPYVFRRPRSIMSAGAWILLLFMGIALVYASFFWPGILWASLIVLRRAVAVVGLILAVILVAYPGIELGEAKGRPFWQGAALVPLYLVSALTGGLALGLVLLAFNPPVLELQWGLNLLVILQILFSAAYLLAAAKGVPEAKASAASITGGYLKTAWWVGVVLVGTVLAVIFSLVGAGPVWQILQGSAAFIGVVCLRYCWYYAPLRLLLPGEAAYLKRPVPDEAFLDSLRRPWMGEIQDLEGH